VKGADHLSIEGIRKGYFFREKWYLKGYGVGPRGGACPYKNLLSNPPGFSTVKKILKELPTVNCKARSWDIFAKDRSCCFFGAVEQKKKFRIESGFAPPFA